MAPLQGEFEIARKARQMIEDVLTELGPFVSLAQAARDAGVPLQTLAEAVRTGRVPGLKVLGRSWVRPSAVRLYFGRDVAEASATLQRRLVEDGLLDEVKPRLTLRDFEPQPYRGRSASELLIEERR
jgi:hypothetical protein